MTRIKENKNDKSNSISNEFESANLFPKYAGKFAKNCSLNVQIISQFVIMEL